MRRVHSIWIILFALSTNGCAIHPLPNDVTRDSTVSIVQKLRCEAKQALIRNATNKEININDVRYSLGIGYDFNFKISEANENSGSLQFSLPFSNGRFGLGVGLGEEKSRESERKFKIGETFDDLMTDPLVADSVCAASENWQYPITGKIGLDEVVKTFLDLSGLGKFDTSGSQDKDEEDGPKKATGKSKNIVAFTDIFLFTTTYNGSINPKLNINPVTDQFKLTEASASIGASRKDAHKVTITMVFIPPAKGKGRGKEFLYQYDGGAILPGRDAANAAIENLLREEDIGFKDRLRVIEE